MYFIDRVRIRSHFGEASSLFTVHVMSGVLCNVAKRVRTRAQPKRPRLVCDRKVSVEQLQHVLSVFLESRPTRDLDALLRPIMTSSTWKTSPMKTVQSLVELSDLFKELLYLCPNSIVPKKN